MEYRRLGKSGLQVSELSLGSWLTFGKQIENNIAEDLMKMAYEHGVNFFDNAEIYANGESEIVMGEILKKMGWARDSYIVSSKVFFGVQGLKVHSKMCVVEREEGKRNIATKHICGQAEFGRGGRR